MERPGLWKVAPAAVTKPWGLVHQEALELTGIEVGVGELWLASAQTGPGNYSNTVVEPALRKTLAELLQEAAAEGDSALEPLLGAHALSHLHENPHRGKTEAWYIRAVKGHTGLVSGPRSAEQADRLRDIILNQGLPPDVEAWSQQVRELFGLIEPLQGGEVFLTPAGVLHTMFAIGPESHLIIDELQQGYGESLLPTLTKVLMIQNDLLSVQVHPGDSTVADAAEGRLQVDQDLQANPTVRIYDFGRRPGEYPELGFSLVDPTTGLRRVMPVELKVGGQQSLQIMVAAPQFARSRIRVSRGGGCDLAVRYGSYRTLHCLRGSAELSAGKEAMGMAPGETVFVPACLERELRIRTDTGCSLFDDTLPDLTVLTDFLETHGVESERVEALLNPARAL
ncbi:MAG: hypothetical protein KAX44_07120 [Candidatus Brocadiae bacterium]|nr:hypothetical protein [Candidatus Brocadiia bacterium]